MIILGIETSTVQASVTLGSEQGVIASSTLSRGASHEEFLIPAIGFLLDKSRLSFNNISGVAVGLGPGLYTSMRVGVATAKTLAQALAAPIVGIPSLDLLAFDVRYTNRVICPVQDAKRNEVFFAFYRQVPGGITRISEYLLGGVPRLVAEIGGRAKEILVVGNGALIYRPQLKELEGVEFGAVANAFPQAVSLVELALPRFFREEYDSLFETEPMYMRRSDAEINWGRRRSG
jgi:tRNA threonylcarbamoyladenosine biosynthesis protein TsaB